MKKAKSPKKKIKEEEVKEEIPEEPITVERIFGEKVSPFSVFEVENQLRESCQAIMDPVIKSQTKLTDLIKVLTNTISTLKSDLENNEKHIKDMRGEMKAQQTINKRLKETQTQKSSEIEKIGRYVTTHGEKMNAINDSMKKVRDEQQALDQRFSATFKSIESIKEVVVEDIKRFKGYMQQDFVKLNDKCTKIHEIYNKNKEQMKSINATFDRFNTCISTLEYKTTRTDEKLEKVIKDFEKFSKKKSEQELYEEIKHEFENLKSYTTFAMEEGKKKNTELLEFLTHFTPIQTHLQVLEAFEYLDCLSSQSKLDLFKVHKSRMLKLMQSKKSTEYYFINETKRLSEKIDQITKNSTMSLIDPKLIERVAAADTEAACQTDPTKFTGKTNYREIWLMRAPKRAYQYSQHLSRYTRMTLRNQRKRQKEAEDSFSQSNEYTLQSEISHQESIQEEKDDKMTPLPDELGSENIGPIETPELQPTKTTQPKGVKLQVSSKSPEFENKSIQMSKISERQPSGDGDKINALKSGYFEATIDNIDQETNPALVSRKMSKIDSEVSSSDSNSPIGIKVASSISKDKSIKEPSDKAIKLQSIDENKLSPEPISQTKTQKEELSSKIRNEFNASPDKSEVLSVYSKARSITKNSRRSSKLSRMSTLKKENESILSKLVIEFDMKIAAIKDQILDLVAESQNSHTEVINKKIAEIEGYQKTIQVKTDKVVKE